MKALFSLTLLVLFCSVGYSQTTAYDSLMNLAKNQFTSDTSQNADYTFSIEVLKKAIGLNPNNAEAHYYLGNAYSRLSSRNGETIPDSKMPLVLKASEELEKVISIDPLYKGEIIELDPYSKITSEWGALALCYLVNEKPDSAAWAFKEGKKRGGFDDFILSISRAVLNGCSKNAILLSSGDNFTFPLYYLKTIENARPDISFFDVGLLNTSWFPRFAQRTTNLKFGVKEATLDTLGYRFWSDTTISVPIEQTGKFFTWLVKPIDDGKYLLRGDLLFISLLKENKFQRDVYLTEGFSDDEKLSLEDRLSKYPLLEKINAKNEPDESIDLYVDNVKSIVSTLKPVNSNSQAEWTPIDILRWQIVNKMKEIEKNDPTSENKLYKLLTDDLPLSKYPCYDNDELMKYLKSIEVK
jgi:hypothetical protein